MSQSSHYRSFWRQVFSITCTGSDNQTRTPTDKIHTKTLTFKEGRSMLIKCWWTKVKPSWFAGCWLTIVR